MCDHCLAEIQPIHGPVCSLCGERLLVAAPMMAEDEPRCGPCRAMEPVFQKAAAYGSYDGGLRDLLHLLKYEHVRPAAEVLGRMLAEILCWLAPHFEAAPLVIPVPLHAHKLRHRGFNQSELIARAAVKLKPAGMQLQLNTVAMLRQRDTGSQTGLSRKQRQENMRGAFCVVRPNEVAGSDILLIDDVFTTGATVSECARVLRRAGANRVWVATVARVLKPEATHVELPGDFALPEEDETEPQSMAAHA